MSELLQVRYRPGSVFNVNKCPSYAVVCRTHLLAVLNVPGLDSGPTMLTALLVQQLSGSLMPTLERAPTQARLHPGFMCSQIILPSSLKAAGNMTQVVCCVCYHPVQVLDIYNPTRVYQRAECCVLNPWTDSPRLSRSASREDLATPHTCLSFQALFWLASHLLPLFRAAQCCLFCRSSEGSVKKNIYSETLSLFLTAVFVSLSLLWCIQPPLSLHLHMSSKPQLTHTHTVGTHMGF